MRSYVPKSNKLTTDQQPDNMANGHSNGVPEPLGPSKLDEVAGRISGSLKQMGALLRAFKAPLPTETGDGSELPPQPDDDPVKKFEEILSDLKKIGFANLENLVEVKKSLLERKPLNDREYRMEKLIQAAAVLPPDELGTGVTDDFLTNLWNDLQHPPQVMLGKKYEYRTADGSYNASYYWSPNLHAVR